mgnify:CR=1 FL=1
MKTAELKEELIQLLSELFQCKGFDTELLEYADLINDLGMDSITFISIVIEIESRFGIEVPDEMLQMENFKTVDDIVKVVTQELA